IAPKAGEKLAVTTLGKAAKGKTTAKTPVAAPKAGAPKAGAPKAGAPKAAASALRVKLIRIAGTAKDDSGVAGVQVAIRRISAGRPARTAAVKRTKQCTFFDPAKAKFMKKPCRKPTYFNVHLKGANWDWAYRVKH